MDTIRSGLEPESSRLLPWENIDTVTDGKWVSTDDRHSVQTLTFINYCGTEMRKTKVKYLFRR
jgi:hypothetical protein